MKPRALWTSRVSILFLTAAMMTIAACSDDSTVAPAPVPPTNDRYVNQATGSDANSGSAGSPWKTISHAVATADSMITIRVAPGTYNTASGETFPITMKEGQRLIGDVANKGAGTTPTLIQGEAAYTLGMMEGTAVIGADDTHIAGFSFDNDTHALGYGGILADGVRMEIDHNTFLNPMYVGVIGGNGADLDIHENIFQTPYYGVWAESAGVVELRDNIAGGYFTIRAYGAADLTVRNNTMNNGTGCIQCGGPLIAIEENSFNYTGNYGAISVDSGSPTIRNNTFTGNAALYVEYAGNPDAGTGAIPGGNNFSAITGPAVKHTGTGTVMAIGNTWAHDPPQEGVDYTITGGGTVVTQ
ncbi:MAG: DUF1565 domain-containing protein [Candidatus Krumholzibacteria bacterium]|nr:DUF1565 domain-containing protein [Candidatus Krumholzibacteria bacterium]MDH4338378.1 DUF1565 domain-containing protein [Candidatus Krumholzibacteria bacterium]MDH5270863.1 DUF1565 domain-containing protein [Candidatus Krumholzibacteria bacterium]MDH5627123.1 DUF1565 domain-containing protein [Candidatus Krumholzibacteria bacterium]